jgi:plasmid maintenance system killer protein
MPQSGGLNLHALHQRSSHNNQLGALGGDRKGKHSIRINRPVAALFRVAEDGPHGVELVDYR